MDGWWRIAIAEAGSDWLKWHVREVATGKDLPDVVEWSKFSGASWLKDGSGFFYEGYGHAEGCGGAGESLKEANYFHKVFFHKLGTPQSADTLVFERPDDKELNVGRQCDGGRAISAAVLDQGNEPEQRAFDQGSRNIRRRRS